MSKKIQFTDLAIQKLFQDFYLIPDYQREYVWEEKEVAQLLNDIYDEFIINPDSEYFLGSIVVCKSKESHKFEVIDGQQRLITLSLVLNNIRRLYKNARESYSTIEKLLFSETITDLGETFSSNIIDIQYEGKDVLYDLYKADNDDEIHPKMVEGLPGKTIFDAHKNIFFFFDDNFNASERIPNLKRFLGYFLNKVKLIQIETPEIGKALKIFETINERGISLDQVDLLKNLLFIQIDRNDFPKLKKEWEKFKSSILGKKEKEKPLRFLRYFIMANYEVLKDKKSSQIVREDDIYPWFIDNEKRCNYKSDPFGFVRKIEENAAFYMNLIKNRYYNDNNLYLDNTFKLVGSGFKQHFILLLSAKSLKPELFNHLIKQLEILLFYYIITKEPPRDIEKRFADWTGEIRSIKTSENLNDFISSRIKNDIENRNRIYENNFLNLHASFIQKYKLKYIIGKLAQFVDRARLGETENSSLEPYIKKSIHIEHILPESPTSDILEDFSKGNRTEYNDYKEKLGNLTLLERPINTSIKRDFFLDKCEKYSKSNFYFTRSICSLEEVGVNTSINRINNHLSSFSKWGKDSIDNRHKMLLELSKMVWKIELFNE